MSVLKPLKKIFALFSENIAKCKGVLVTFIHKEQLFFNSCFYNNVGKKESIKCLVKSMV